jgi:LysM repeat protein
MASVYTDLGPGEVTETKTIRGRTEYRVAAHDGSFDMWLPATKIGFADVDTDNSVNLPYNPTPQYGVGALTDATIQPIHEIDPDKRLHPADSLSFDSRGESEGGNEPGPAAHLFAAGIDVDMSGSTGLPSSSLPYGAGGIQQGHDDAHADWMANHGGPGGDAWEHESPYYNGQHPSQDYLDAQGGGGEPHDTPPDDWHPSDEYGDLNQPYPADTWRGQDAEMNRFGGYRQADVLEGAPTRFEPDMIVNDTDDEFLHNQDVEKDERETTGPDGIVHFARQHTAWAAAIPAVAEAIGPAVARGVGMGAAESALGGGDEDPGQNGGTPQSGAESVNGAMDQMAPDGHPLPIPGLEGTGWGDLTQKRGSTGHNLDSRYAEIIAAHDPSDKVAQFRHDPDAFINRVGHVEFEGLNPRMASYIDMVDADESLRTAAWKDVREKATRLRREGRVHVKDVGPDRIYASVQGDHGTYDVMIKKGGAFGGFGGGHAVSNWHCSCEWGKWAFQRRFTFIGRLCSHGYASYQEMQSQHLKGVSQKRKRVNPRNRTASDQTEKDWTVDGDVPTSELGQLRSWAEQEHDTWNGSQADHVDDVQDTVQRARDEGVDADQLVASLHRQADSAWDALQRAQSDYPTQGQVDPKSVQTSAPSTAPSTNFGPAIGGPGQPAYPGYAGGQQHINPTHGKDAPSTGPNSPSGIGTGINGPQPGGGAPPAAPAAPGAPAAPAPSPSGGTSTPMSDPGGGSASPGTGGIGMGDYKIQSGDTLSDIAQRSGYGGDYNSLAQQNHIADPNKINAGDTIKIGDPKASAGEQQAGSAPSPAAPASSESGASVAAPVKVNTEAVGGTSSPVQTDTSNMTSDTGSDTSSGAAGGGAGGQSTSPGSPASAADAATDATKTSALQVEADRDWFEAAYPDRQWHDHLPFNGSGGLNVTEWGSSKENVKDNYSDNLQDVTEEPSGSYLTDTAPLKDMQKGKDPVTASVGIQRAGHGPQRQAVEPVVVRERKPRRPGTAAVAVEAEHIPDEFDPLAPRTAASFDDPYAQSDADAHAVLAAANRSSNDIVAQFQANGGGAVFVEAQSGGDQYDDFASSPAIRQAMQRTAGRNYSLAEQDALIREGDKGGAGNLGDLQLAGTHYEAMNSVGLW